MPFYIRLNKIGSKYFISTVSYEGYEGVDNLISMKVKEQYLKMLNTSLIMIFRKLEGLEKIDDNDKLSKYRDALRNIDMYYGEINVCTGHKLKLDKILLFRNVNELAEKELKSIFFTHIQKYIESIDNMNKQYVESYEFDINNILKRKLDDETETSNKRARLTK